MKDKEKIKEEIERRIELLEPLECEYNQGSIDAYKGILRFINSLPEESKKQPKFKVGNTIKGPCNNIFQVKEVLDKQYVLHSENGDELNSIEIVDKYSCISEEPTDETIKGDYNERYKRIAQTEQFKQSYCNKSLGKEESTSKDLEEAAFKYRCEHRTCDAYTIDAFKAGAEWQKQQMMKDAVDAFVNTYENTDDSNYVEFVTEQSPYKFKETEKCKIIIVKED